MLEEKLKIIDCRDNLYDKFGNRVDKYVVEKYYKNGNNTWVLEETIKTEAGSYFVVDEKFYFVDLPGYGYSKMSQKEQEQVGKFIEEYLFNRQQISLIIFLVDIRHSPTSNDKLMYDYVIRSGLPCMILANKADKIAITKVDDTTNNLQKLLNPIGDIPTFPFSSERKIYKDVVWQEIEKLLNSKRR